MAKDRKKNNAAAEEHGTKSSVVEQLKQLGEWGETDEIQMGELPDGRYQVKILSATVNNSKSESHRLQVSWDLLVLNTKERGRHIFKHSGLDDMTQRGFFRGELARLGVEWPPTPDKLADELEDLKETFASVSLRTKGEEGKERQYANFDKALDSADLEDGDISGKEGDKKEDEDKPSDTGKSGGKKEKKETPKKEPEKEEEADASATFEDNDLRSRMKNEIKDLGKKADFKEGDYNTLTDMLLDIAEYAGVKGEWSDPMELITETKEALEKKLND